MAIMLLEIQPEVLAGIVGAFGVVLAASIPYYFTKRNEIAMNIQKTKLDRYDDLLQKFVSWLQTISETDLDQDQRKKASIELIMAYQRASSYATPKVLSAIKESIDFQTSDPSERFPSKEGEDGFRIPTPEEATKIARESRRTTNNVFIAIRENILPKEEHFEFDSIIHPSHLDRR